MSTRNAPQLVCFVVPPSLHVLMYVGVTFFGLLCVGANVDAFLTTETQTRHSDVIASAIFAVFGMGSALVLVWCRRHRLAVGADEIQYRGLFRSKSIASRHITSVEWRPLRSRCRRVVLRANTQRLVLDTDSYGVRKYHQLLTGLRAAIPETAEQSGWRDEFMAPFPPPRATHRPERIFRFTCWASGIGWLAFAAIWIWLSRLEPDLELLPNMAWSAVACGFFPAAVAFFWWLDRLDEREASRP